MWLQKLRCLFNVFMQELRMYNCEARSKHFEEHAHDWECPYGDIKLMQSRNDIFFPTYFNWEVERVKKLSFARKSS